MILSITLNTICFSLSWGNIYFSVYIYIYIYIEREYHELTKTGFSTDKQIQFKMLN